MTGAARPHAALWRPTAKLMAIQVVLFLETGV
jgi:hypothetical protein